MTTRSPAPINPGGPEGSPTIVKPTQSESNKVDDQIKTVTPEAMKLAKDVDEGVMSQQSPNDILKQMTSTTAKDTATPVQERKDVQISPEQQRKLLEEAMGEYAGVFDGTNKLKVVDLDYVDIIGRIARRIASLPGSGEYRRDMLARPIDQMATQFGTEMVHQVNQIGQQAEQLGLGRSESENTMNDLLGQIATTEDPIQKTSLVQRSMQLFQETTQNIEKARLGQRKQRVSLEQQSEQNESWARYKSTQANEYTRLDKYSAPAVYEVHSRNLVRYIKEKGVNVLATENNVIDDNQQHQERFIRMMDSLNRIN